MSKALIYKDAEAHFREHGDTIEFKDGGNPNASYETVRGNLTAYAYSRLKDWLDAEDAVQEAYCRVIEQARYPEGNFGGLFKVVLDATIADMYRKDAVREHIQEEDHYDEEEGVSLIELAEGDEVTPDRALEIQEKINFIMSSSNKMAQKPKAIVRMSFIFGYTTAEISTVLKIQPRKVTNTLNYFRKKLIEWEK